MGLLLFVTILPDKISGQITKLKFYPYCFDSIPGVQSPAFINDTIETVLVITKENKYALVPVTVENGKPLLYSRKVGYFIGKDQQLLVDKADFPILAEAGLHSDSQLYNIKTITEVPLHVINYTGRPNAYSSSGFLADDEDIISVIKNDNTTVRELGQKHPQLARPLFHIWNLILKEYETGNLVRHYNNIKNIYYNDNLLNFRILGSKGWQVSIFNDEIQGSYNIHIDRNLTIGEEEYLNRRYSYLGVDKLNELKYKLSNIDFSEMLPFYIMRYGFYEGHTEYRTDPISIAFIFNLQSLEEIDKNIGGNLYNSLTDHFVSK